MNMGKPFACRNSENESNINSLRLSHNLTIKKLAKESGVSAEAIVTLSSGIRSPINRKRMLTDSAQKLCKFFDVDPEDLFPRYFCSITNYYTLMDSFSESTTFQCSDSYLETVLTFKEIINKLSKIKKTNGMQGYSRIELVLRHYINEETLKELGDQYGITRERCRQVINIGLRDIRKILGVEIHG